MPLGTRRQGQLIRRLSADCPPTMRAGPKGTTRYVSATAVHVCAGLAAGCRRMSVGCLRLCYRCVLPGSDSRKL